MKKIMISIIVTVVVILGICGIDMYRNYCVNQAYTYAVEWLDDFREIDDHGVYTRIERKGLASFEIEYGETAGSEYVTRTISYVPFKGVVNTLGDHS